MQFHTLISQFRNKIADLQVRSELSTADIDEFYDALNKFEFILFADYYRKYIANLNRLKPEAGEIDPDLTVLQLAIAENKWKPTTPFSIAIHQIKYKYKLTSKPFLALQKKQNRKKLNASGAKAKLDTKLKANKEWIKIPLPKNDSK